MFKFFKKPKIEFYPLIPQLAEMYPPESGKKDLISLLKNIVPVKKNKNISFSSNTSIKNCPGIIEYIKHGYVIKAWQDIIINTTADGENFQWKSATRTNNYITNQISEDNYFNNEVISFYKDYYHPYFGKPNTLKHVIQIPTRWFVKLPKDYAALFLPVWYDKEDRFTVIPGLLPAGSAEDLNVFLQWNKLGTEEIIKAGTPLLKVIPFKYENFDVVIRQMNSEDIYKFKKKSLISTNQF